MAVFLFRQVFKKSLSREYNRSGRKVTYYIGCNFFMNSIDKKTWHGGVFMKKDEILNASRKEHRNRTWLKWKWYIKPEVTQAELVL